MHWVRVIMRTIATSVKMKAWRNTVYRSQLVHLEDDGSGIAGAPRSVFGLGHRLAYRLALAHG